jgi:TolA-binding protein
MKEKLLFCVFVVSFAFLAAPLRAQETPAALAERLDAEERYKRLTADIEDLKLTLQSCQQRLNEQREEIKRLNEELTRSNSNKDVITRDDLKRLADKIREVDEKRIADDEKVMAEFGRLRKDLIAAPPVREKGPSTPPSRPTAVPTGDKGYEYVIRAGDNPRVIAQALVKQGMKISSKQITDANPAIVDWSKLRVGQKIFIPAVQP